MGGYTVLSNPVIVGLIGIDGSLSEYLVITFFYSFMQFS